mmetsp:Transcript_18843/g.58620  ORF Transcript_18843/g.58620 Transcript_18843/m.58620 type:complete len:206 (+) Transcript_18843:1053-1670(+)
MAPSRPLRTLLFTSTTCMSVIVISSSLVPACPTISTLGRMHTGGTVTCVRISRSGRSRRSRSSQSRGSMREKSSSTRTGVRSSCTRPAPRCDSSSRLRSRAHTSSRVMSSGAPSFPQGSCVMRSADATLRTAPLVAPQCGHNLQRLHASTTFLRFRLRVPTSPPRRMASSIFSVWRDASTAPSSGSSTRPQRLQMHCSSVSTDLK